MRKRKRQERRRKAIHDLLWSDQHWLFVTEEAEGRSRLQALVETEEVRWWGGSLEAFLVEDLGPHIPALFVGGIPKKLLPPQVMCRLLDRVHIAYTPRWLAGLAPILFVCREVSRAQVLMRALADFVGWTRFEWTGDIAASE
jgi:hypothetical protein